MNKSNFKTQSLTRREFSAGGVVFKKRQVVGGPLRSEASKLQVRFLLGKHSGYHKWALPKGLIEKGERSGQTAIRETEEEMGVRAKLVTSKPIHKITYFYWAELKPQPVSSNQKPVKDTKTDRSTRRVIRYQEQGGKKTKVFKTVTFYLLEYVSGSPKDHGWEMEDAGWFSAKEALKKMSFEGEKEALKIAQKCLE
jgi:8-oxo-dGTP pyrophosphatase MutT (NUDIX family)